MVDNIDTASLLPLVSMENTETVSSQLSLSGATSDEPTPVVQPAPVEELREQDRFLPVANINRIMKRDIPRNGKISKDAKECMQECASEFISFIASEASERCQQEKRKTITGDDIIHAMLTLGFDNYVQPLKVLHAKCREYLKGPPAGIGSSKVSASSKALASFSKESDLLASLPDSGLLEQFTPFTSLSDITGSATVDPSTNAYDSLSALTAEDLSAPVAVADDTKHQQYIMYASNPD